MNKKSMTNLHITISPLCLQHVSGVAALEAACFAEPWSPESITAKLDDQSQVFFVAEQNGVVAGYAGMATVLDEGYIHNIAVAPSMRQRGIASTLLDALHSEATVRGLSFISLEVRMSNRAAVQLYSRFGYKEEGVRPGFYRFPKEDALIMTKWL